MGEEYYFLDNDVIIRDSYSGEEADTHPTTISYYQAVTDNLGSIIAVYDNSKCKVFEASYDAWGKQTVTLDEIDLHHGYTGHEMLFRSGLIHMDGRVYDPAIGRFLSPDNYVQLSENSQSFNRYSYCINNPLKYTDPTGQFFHIGFIGASLLAANAFANAMTTDFGSKFFVSSAISIFSPAVSGAIGGIFGHSVGSFGKELLRAGAHGLASGVANALTGENFGAGFASGALASFAGSGAQWAGLGKGGVLGATTLFGGIGSVAFGGDFLEGAMTGLNIGLYNHTWEEGGIAYNDDEPGNITGQIDEVFVDGYHQNHLTLSPPTAPVEKGLELVHPEFEILTGIRAIFNGAFKATASFVANTNATYNRNIEFGNNPNATYHTFRHTDKLGLDRAVVKKAVLQDAESILKDIPIGGRVSTSRYIEVNGIKLQYNIYGRSIHGKVIYNVGRINGVGIK